MSNLNENYYPCNLGHMIICIKSVLPQSDLDALRKMVECAEFVEGKATAGWHAKAVKNNLQLASGQAATASANEIVSQALMNNELFRMAARPKRLSPVLFSKYEQGMAYGAHVDDAFMGEMRSDLSFTLFLAEPGDYDGGELVMDQPQGEQAFKLDVGDMVLYPSTTLHRVEAVTRGVRLAAVGWVHSRIRQSEQRELLFDLETARLGLFQRSGKTAEFDLLSKSLANLLRMWGE